MSLIIKTKLYKNQPKILQVFHKIRNILDTKFNITHNVRTSESELDTGSNYVNETNIWFLWICIVSYAYYASVRVIRRVKVYTLITVA